VKTSSDISSDDRAAIWTILEENMKQIDSSFGWNPTEKQEELFHPLSRFIIARGVQANTTEAPHDDLSPPVIAYVMFRFEREAQQDVAYCYELQVRQNMRRAGLGKSMMRQLVSIGTNWHMEKVLLTVFKSKLLDLPPSIR